MSPTLPLSEHCLTYVRALTMIIFGRAQILTSNGENKAADT